MKMVFVSEVVADESPLEPGIFLIPAGAVDAPPPAVPEGKRAKYTDETFVLEDLPVQSAEDETHDPVDSRRRAIHDRLASIDFESIRPSREIATALAAGEALPAYPVSKLNALEKEATTLRAELIAL